MIFDLFFDLRRLVLELLEDRGRVQSSDAPTGLGASVATATTVPGWGGPQWNAVTIRPMRRAVAAVTPSPDRTPHQLHQQRLTGQTGPSNWGGVAMVTPDVLGQLQVVCPLWGEITLLKHKREKVPWSHLGGGQRGASRGVCGIHH